jgi:F0F1-type ATP synthase membrane subunit b/b'
MGGHISEQGFLGGLIIGGLVAGFSVLFHTDRIWGRGRNAIETRLRVADANEAAAVQAREMDRAEHVRELAAMQAEHQREFEAIRAEHERELAEIRPEHERQLAEIRAEHERQLAEIRAEHQRERELFAGLVDRDHRDSRRADDADGTSEFRFALAILMAVDSAGPGNGGSRASTPARYQ